MIRCILRNATLSINCSFSGCPQVEQLDMPESAKKVFEEEMEKFMVLEKNSSEFNVTRSYLDWLTALPWGKFSDDSFDIPSARQVLDEVGTITLMVARFEYAMFCTRVGSLRHEGCEGAYS